MSLVEDDELAEPDEESLLDEAAEDELAALLGSQGIDPAQFSQQFISDLVDRVMLFMREFVEPQLISAEKVDGGDIYPYQEEPARRIVESVLINDGEEITLLFSRQSGKTEIIADTLVILMILLPRLAKLWPALLGKFAKGVYIGTFAPTDEQATILFSRMVDRLTSDHAVDFLLDEEIDDQTDAKGRTLTLLKCGSFVRMQTANPRAKIEGRSYHILVGDEAQDIDDYVWNKSISPMGAFYNATTIKLGTPATHKGMFYRAIRLNKRRQTRHGSRRCHFEYDWKVCARFNKNYARYVAKERLKLGEDSDEFQLAYALKWLLERGMFVTSEVMEELGDKSMQIQHAWWKTPVLVGIDPARKQDSTVVTVVWVDWNRPDEFGMYDHRVLNWLELHGDKWEEQYYQIADFLSNYDMLAIAVDGQGMGDVVADRLARLFPSVEVIALPSDRAEQSKRWKHLMNLLGKRMVGWPAHAKTRRLRTWRRFSLQMTDAEKHYDGPYILIEAPDEADAHDDYVDSLALACALTADMAMPEVEVSSSPFYERRR